MEVYDISLTFARNEGELVRVRVNMLGCEIGATRAFYDEVFSPRYNNAEYDYMTDTYIARDNTSIEYRDGTYRELIRSVVQADCLSDDAFSLIYEHPSLDYLIDLANEVRDSTQKANAKESDF
ncbi:MAG: hypothetical protein KJ723_04140 [candidate division Zixibacteria bacterium]|nr:hypothetical protein [candidate division Zixibacteria bacterium]